MEGFQQTERTFNLRFLPMKNVGFNLISATKLRLTHHNGDILRVQNQLSNDHRCI